MAEEEAVDFTKLPIDERCGHKNWKARVSAYEQLIKIFRFIDDDKSPEWNKYASLVRKFPSDTNAAAQEKGLEATLLFLENSALAGKIVGEVVAAVINKGLIAPKAKSKELSVEITMMCIEIEKLDAVQEELMKGMEVKNPKVVAATIGLTTTALRQFGPKIFNLKLLVKKLPVLIEDRDKTVREETKKLIIEFFKWIGTGFKTHLHSIKPAVMSELDAEYEKKLRTEKPRQTRFLRSHQAKKEKQAAEAVGEDEDAGAAEEIDGPEIDPYDLLEPVDILSKLPKEFTERCEAKKWQDRKDVLEELNVLTSNPKLEPGDYGDLVRLLKRIISKDANVIVVAIAGKCLTGLALGLKKKFSSYAPSCIGTILDKFKEKKSNVLTAMREASDACYAATTLEHIQEDVVQALGNKNPNIKVETALLLARGFAKTPYKIMSDKKLMKPYLTAVLSNLNEPDPSVRDAAAEALGVALKAMGEKAVSPYLQDVEPAKLQKVKEFAEKAVVMVQKVPVSRPVPPKTAPGALPPGAMKVERPPAVTEPLPSGILTRPVLGRVKRPPKIIIPISSHPPKQNQNDYDFGPSKAISPSGSPIASPTPLDKNGPVDISVHITSNLIEKLSDKSWKIREDHLDKVSRLIENRQIQPNLNDLPQALSQRLQDSNRNIALSAILLCGNLATALGPNAKHVIRTMLPSILAGLCDNKTNVRSNVIACMNAWAEHAGVDKFFQGECIYDALKGNNPYLRMELFNWLSTRLPDVKNISKDELNICIPILFASVEDRNPDVRKSAQEVLPAFMIHLGYETMSRAAAKLKPASKMIVTGLLDKHRPAVAERTATKHKNTGGLTHKVDKKATINSLTSRVENPKFVRPAPAPKSIVVSPNNKNADSPNTRKSAESPNSKKPMETFIEHNSFEEDLEAAVEEPYIEQPVYQQNVVQDDFNSKPPRGRNWTCPPEYQIDFDAVDNMFGPSDLEPMPPLRLYDTNIDYIRNEAPVTLPPRRCVTKGYAQPGDLYVPPRASQSIDLVVSQVGSPDLQLSLEAIVQLDAMMSDMEVANVMSARIDHLLSMISSQLRRSQPFLQTPKDDRVDDYNKLFRSIVQLIQTLYKGTIIPMRVTKESLKELIYQLLSLIVDDCIGVLPDGDLIIRHVNILICRIIERSDPNAIVCGLVRLLNETLQTNPNNQKLMDLTMKCQWKLLKQFGNWDEASDYPFDIESYLKEFFAFMKAHPFASFNDRDITPLKTMKTILHGIINKLGGERVEAVLIRVPDYRSTEAGAYLNKLIHRGKVRSDYQSSECQTTEYQSSESDGNDNAQPHVNNNVEDFFARLPDPRDVRAGQSRSTTYLQRLKLIQKRSGLDNNIY